MNGMFFLPSKSESLKSFVRTGRTNASCAFYANCGRRGIARFGRPSRPLCSIKPPQYLLVTTILQPGPPIMRDPKPHRLATVMHIVALLCPPRTRAETKVSPLQKSSSASTTTLPCRLPPRRRFPPLWPPSRGPRIWPPRLLLLPRRRPPPSTRPPSRPGCCRRRCWEGPLRRRRRSDRRRRTRPRRATRPLRPGRPRRKRRPTRPPT